MLYIVPLEPLQERYTAQWKLWIPEALKTLSIPFVEVEGDSITTKIEVGDVLDVYGTHYWKFSQLQKLILMIREGEIKTNDTIWFADLWFPGIEALFYIRNMTGIRFKIKGVLHAGTWDSDDFTYRNGMRGWGKFIEQGWLHEFDEVFLGSEFHKDIILKNCPTAVEGKLKVTGLFFDAPSVKRYSVKENIVVFPHRKDPEKHPELFKALAEELKDRKGEDWKFICCKDVCQTKEDYYKLLGKAKIAISYATQETFGYAMLEAYANDCACIVPNDRSYATMLPYKLKTGYFNSFEESVKKVEDLMHLFEVGYVYQSVGRDIEMYSVLEVAKKMFL